MLSRRGAVNRKIGATPRGATRFAASESLLSTRPLGFEAEAAPILSVLPEIGDHLRRIVCRSALKLGTEFVVRVVDRTEFVRRSGDRIFPLADPAFVNQRRERWRQRPAFGPVDVNRGGNGLKVADALAIGLPPAFGFGRSNQDDSRRHGENHDHGRHGKKKRSDLHWRSSLRRSHK
jgi:hypothetical protein